MDSSNFFFLHHRLILFGREIPILWVALAMTVVILFGSNARQSKTVKVPTVTIGEPFLPKSFSRLTFNFWAPKVIHRGYKKYKNAAFKVLRHDGEIVVLSNRYCEELRALPETKLNALEATFADHVGDYTTILTGSHLHTDAIQKRLTPALGRVVPGLISELDHAFESEFPDCTDWVSIKPFSLLSHLVARAGSRPWVGDTLCRNEVWLDASINFMMDFYKTVTILRAFPTFLHPIVSKILPSVKRLQRQLQEVKSLIIPVIRDRRILENSGDPDYQKPDDMLQWYMDLAENEDAEPGNLANRLLGIMSMAVVPTSTMTATHVLYDLIIRSEYVELLREEILQTLPGDWKESTQADLMNLKQLDSFMRESQRFNPPGECEGYFSEELERTIQLLLTVLVAFHRIVKQTITLSDGLKLPAGTHICMASGPISMDKDIMDGADEFDGLRWFRENKSTASFVYSGPTSLHFGLGRFACPGRYFAAYTIKGILSRMILDYEFKFGDDQHGRPKNLIIGDKIAPNMNTEIWFRKRRVQGRA